VSRELQLGLELRKARVCETLQGREDTCGIEATVRRQPNKILLKLPDAHVLEDGGILVELGEPVLCERALLAQRVQLRGASLEPAAAERRCRADRDVGLEFTEALHRIDEGFELRLDRVRGLRPLSRF